MRLSVPFLGLGDHFQQYYDEKGSKIDMMADQLDNRRFMSPDGSGTCLFLLLRQAVLKGGASSLLDRRWTRRRSRIFGWLAARATVPGRACAAATAARHLCRRHSSQRLACLHRRGYGAAAAWSGGTSRRQPGLGLAGERLRLGAEAQ
jgi:hypothetical protein